jgi:hypothetical protein
VHHPRLTERVTAIKGTTLTVLLFSDQSNRSPHVHREIERTVSHGIPIVPFRVDDVVPSPSLEYFISDAHWLDAMTPPMEQHLDHLVGTVRLLLERAAGDAASAAAVSEDVAPVEQPGAYGPSATTAKRPTWWRWAALGATAVVGAVVAVVLLLGGGGKGGTTLPSAAPSSSATHVVPSQGGAKLGTTVTLTGMDAGSKAEVTVMKVVDPTTSRDDTPSAGRRYVAVQVRIHNTGTLAYDDAPDNSAKLVDAGGNRIEETTVYSIEAGSLFPATVVLHPGQAITGYVVFEVPMTTKIVMIQFALDSGYADDTGHWAVG